MSLSPWAQYKMDAAAQTETLRLNNLIRQHVAEHANTMRFVDTYASLGSPVEQNVSGHAMMLVMVYISHLEVMNDWRNSFQLLSSASVPHHKYQSAVTGSIAMSQEFHPLISN